MLRHVLLTHVMFDFDLGYCQGMSDLAAPLLWVAATALPTPTAATVPPPTCSPPPACVSGLLPRRRTIAASQAP